MNDTVNKHFDKLILTLLFVLLLFAIIFHGGDANIVQALISMFAGIGGAIIALMTGSRNTPRKNDDTSNIVPGGK
jgi:flagellar motor component MotA